MLVAAKNELIKCIARFFEDPIADEEVIIYWSERYKQIEYLTDLGNELLNMY